MSRWTCCSYTWNQCSANISIQILTETLPFRCQPKKSILPVNTIKSIKAVCKSGTRNIPTAFEIFTSNNQSFVLKAKDGEHAELWMQCLQIAVAHSHGPSHHGIAAALWDWLLLVYEHSHLRCDILRRCRNTFLNIWFRMNVFNAMLTRCFQAWVF